jgi:hypothetical protein
MNDLYNNMALDKDVPSMYRKPYFKLDGADKITLKYTDNKTAKEAKADGKDDPESGMKAFLNKSLLYKIIVSRIYQNNSLLMRQGNPLPNPPSFEAYKRNYAPEWNKGYQVTERILLRMGEFCRRRKIRFIVFYIPDIIEIDSKLQAARAKTTGLDLNEYKFDKLYANLTVFCAKNGIDFIDLRDAFMNFKDKRKLYCGLDGHLSVLGNKLASEVVYSFLKNGDSE